MKHLVSGLTFAAVALAQHPNVSSCFKVQSMIRADEAHYWTTWTNACPYTIDSVYVTVRFADRFAKEVADGVWSLHFISPGAHRTIRLSSPGNLADFASVRQQKITSDIGEAFGIEMPRSLPAMSSVEMTAFANDGSSHPRIVPISTVVTDAGERAYRDQPAAQPVPANTVAAAKPAITIGDSGEAAFRTDFPDPWRAVLSAEESAVSPAPRASFVRFVSDDKPLFQ
jgi:hypothetical protein